MFQDDLENATETARFYEAQVGEIEEKVVSKDKIIRDLEQSLQVLHTPSCIAQSVTCLTADACLTADQGLAKSIPAQSHTFVEIVHEIISMVNLLSSADSRSAVISYKRKYVHEVLVNRLVNVAQEKLWLGDLTVLLMLSIKETNSNLTHIHHCCCSKVSAMYQTGPQIRVFN